MDGRQVLERGALAGSRLASRYEIRSLLGQGGMADVYSARDTVLGRDVAVKVLRGSLTHDERALKRFRHEAEAAAGLAHPNIVPLFDIGTDGGVPFIVMELVHGETLSEVIWRDAPLPPERAAEVGEAVADALGFAHAAGIVHRDVKPGNIMLTPWGHVKVLDFGIARALSRARLTTSMELRGTAEYLSPEQARGGELDGRSDIYSLGAVLFEMLTGHPPFESDSALAVARMHIDQDPTPLRQLRPAVPPRLEGIVMQCLEKDPAKRYQRGAQLASDLRRFRSDRSSITAPVPPSPATDSLEAHRPHAVFRSVDGIGRRFSRWTALAASLALIATIAVGAFLFVDRGTPASRPRPPALTPPVAIHATVSCDGVLKAKVELSWSPPRSAEADGYIVYRSLVRQGPYQLLQRLRGRTTPGFTNGQLDDAKTYYYRVASTSGSRITPPSPVIEARTPLFCFS